MLSKWRKENDIVELDSQVLPARPDGETNTHKLVNSERHEETETRNSSALSKPRQVNLSDAIDFISCFKVKATPNDSKMFKKKNPHPLAYVA